jgi:hypothetical protein
MAVMCLAWDMLPGTQCLQHPACSVLGEGHNWLGTATARARMCGVGRPLGECFGACSRQHWSFCLMWLFC